MPLPILLGLLAALGAAAAEDRVTTVRAGAVEVAIHDRERALRSEAVARWLADGLARAGLPDGSWRLVVERRQMDSLVAVEGDRLLLHPRLPSASRDEELMALRLALWILLRPSLGGQEAWVRSRALVDPLRPLPTGPRWWPRCCRGLDAQRRPEEQVATPAGPARDDPNLTPDPDLASGRKAFGRADVDGAFRTPLGDTWPWIIAAAGIWAPLGDWELVAGIEMMPLGLVELRAGAGGARWERFIVRLDGGALLAWDPGSVLPESQIEEGAYHPAGVEAGVWVDAEVAGWRGLLRVLPDQTPGIDAWLGWERRFSLAERWYLLPFARARFVSACLPQRAVSSGGSWGVRWIAPDSLLTDRTLTARAEVEHVLPTGRMLGPAWVRPRAILLRAGVDSAWSPDTGPLAGWTGSLGLALNPVREVRGVAWLVLATPPDLSSLSWFIWFGTWMPRP